jgi:parallel beta-helix repeat protein
MLITCYDNDINGNWGLTRVLVFFERSIYSTAMILLLCFSICLNATSTDSIVSGLSETAVDYVRSETLLTHEPIVITSDHDFILQGWNGNGTKDSPYLLERVSISNNGTCISIRNTSVYFRIKSCVLVAGWNEGTSCTSFYFSNVTNGAIEACDVTSNYIGITLAESVSCEITRCEITGEDAAIIVQESINCNVSYSTVRDYRGDGIHLANSNGTLILFNSVEGGYDCQEGIVVTGSSWNCIIENNTVSDHYSRGIRLYDCMKTQVYNNTITRSGNALVLEESVMGIIKNNTFTNNAFGVSIASYSSNNSLYFNHFKGNPHGNAWDDGSENLWDDGISVGNWWDDYEGFGLYVIGGTAGSVDRFPEPKNSGMIFAKYGPLTAVILIVAGVVALALFLDHKSRIAKSI